MNIESRIQVICQLKEYLKFNSSDLNNAFRAAGISNPWFTEDNCKKAVSAVKNEFLDREKIINWLSHYDISDNHSKNIGLISAGNIPLVGFHDVLSVFLSGHNCILKPSKKDEVLIQYILQLLNKIDDRTKSKIKIVDKIKNIDAIIATGSNNSAAYFDYYFKNSPKIIRRNRTSVGIISAYDKEDELSDLANDVFDYFGLGCRNISKLYIPKGYDLDNIFASFFPFQNVINHNKYKNNYDYNETIYLMNRVPFKTNGFIVLKEDKSIFSRIASLHYEYYENLTDIDTSQADIQCIVGNTSIDSSFIPFGKSQSPTLMDYADNVDTMEFLTSLYHVQI